MYFQTFTKGGWVGTTMYDTRYTAIRKSHGMWDVTTRNTAGEQVFQRAFRSLNDFKKWVGQQEREEIQHDAKRSTWDDTLIVTKPEPQPEPQPEPETRQPQTVLPIQGAIFAEISREDCARLIRSLTDSLIQDDPIRLEIRMENRTEIDWKNGARATAPRGSINVTTRGGTLFGADGVVTDSHIETIKGA